METKTPPLAPPPIAPQSFHMHNSVTNDYRIASGADAIQLGARGYSRVAEIAPTGGWTRNADGAQLGSSTGTNTPMDPGLTIRPSAGNSPK